MSDVWYFARDNQQVGPVPLEQLRRLLASGQVQGQDLVWHGGMPSWVPAASVAELADVVRASVPNLAGYSAAATAAPGALYAATGPPAPITSPLYNYFTPVDDA